MKHWFINYIYVLSGGILLPEASSGRLIVAFFWIFSIVSFATYTGNLIAFLTVSKEDIGIHTLDDLAGQSDLSFGTVEGIIQLMLFKVNTIISLFCMNDENHSFRMAPLCYRQFSFLLSTAYLTERIAETRFTHQRPDFFLITESKGV